jgi:lipoprotein-anchoring transpeptidase ErfK/SrfK
MKFKKPSIFQITLLILIIIPYIGMIFIYNWYNQKSEQIGNAHLIIVSKQEMFISIYDYLGQEKYKFPIACGLNYGDKKEQGDMKTPEGIFRVSEIQKSDNWSHDFNDGNGPVTGAFGPYFIRLYVPNHEGIGIHGTHNNDSLGKRVTEGCIRVRNEDLLRIIPLIHHGTVVIITASQNDLINNIEKSPPTIKN